MAYTFNVKLYKNNAMTKRVLIERADVWDVPDYYRDGKDYYLRRSTDSNDYVYVYCPDVTEELFQELVPAQDEYGKLRQNWLGDPPADWTEAQTQTASIAEEAPRVLVVQK